MILSSCQGTGNKNAAVEIDSTLGLNDYYKDYFLMGVAVSPRSLEGEQAELIKKNFNSLTAENVMKPAPIHPEENRYYWEDADKIVDFAEANGLKMRGHTLCWHNQTGAWMFVDSLGNPASKELALQRLKDHITTVVSHYKGRIYAWDVLNEVITDNDTAKSPLRQTQWLKICGEEYIAKIFQWAHEADPDAILVYNDYNTENPGKRDRIYTMVKGLLDEGVPVHAVGMQGHWEIGNPTEESLRATIDKFSSLGVELHITELDVSIYEGRADTIGVGFTPEREQKQIDLYKMVFDVLREKKDVFTGVTFWNVSDRGSWRDRRSQQGKVYPLLFDENNQPKKAYWEVVKF
ncbi:MAG: endo-1,4-beta-xylanase [Mariniphaga sp.]|nr:endo-1,4-beta-xylanase [Mariniphaga sp.]